MNGETADGKNLQFGFFEYGYFVRIHWGNHGQLTPYYTCPTCGWGKGRQFNGVNTPVIFGYRYTNGEFQLGKGCGSSFQALYKAKFAGPITNIDIRPDNGYHVSMTTSASPSSPSPPAYACDASRDYIRNMAYAQTSLTDYCHIQPAADRPTASGDVCNANPKYGGANSDARALAYCERACTAKPASSCTGFFFQRHRNGHEICGFYSTALGAAHSWNYAGAHAASAVCRRNSLATTKAPGSSGSGSYSPFDSHGSSRGSNNSGSSYNSGSSGSGSYSPFDSYGSSRGSNNSGSSYSKAPAPFVRAAGAANCPVDRMITTEAECRRAGAAIGRPFAKAVNTAAARWTQAVRFGAGFTNCHPLSHGELFIGEQTQAACRARCVASISCMATVQLDRSATGAIRGSAPCWLKNWCQEVAHTGPKTYISFLRDSSVVDGGGGRPAGCFWDQNGRSYLNKNLRGFATWDGVGGLCRGFNATAPPAPPALGEQCLGFNTLPCAKGLVCQDPKKTAVRDVNSCAPGYCWCAKKPTAATAAPAPTPHPSALLFPAAVEAVVMTIRTKLSGFTVSSFSAGIQHAYRLAFARAAGVADAETVFIRNVRQVVAASAAAPTVAAERALAAASGAGPGVAFDVHVATATAAESEALSTRSRALAPAAVVTEFVAQIDAVAASARFADVPPTMAGQFDPARITQETADPHVYTTAQDAGLPTKFYQSAAATAEGEGTEEEGAGGSSFSGPSAVIAAGSGCLVLIGAAVAVHQRGRRTIMALRRTIAAADAADGAGGGIVARNQLEVAIALPIMAVPNGKQLFDPAGGTVLAALPISPSNPAVDMGDPFRLPTMAMAAAMPPVEPVAVAVPVAAPGRRGRAEQQQQQQLAHAVVVQSRHSVVEV
jgi:hypothetical protein